MAELVEAQRSDPEADDEKDRQDGHQTWHKVRPQHRSGNRGEAQQAEEDRADTDDAAQRRPWAAPQPTIALRRVLARRHTRAGRGLQAVLQPVDREAAVIAVEQAQMREDPVGEALAEVHEVIADDRPVAGTGLVHAAEGRARLRFVHGLTPQRRAIDLACGRRQALGFRLTSPISAAMRRLGQGS